MTDQETSDRYQKPTFVERGERPASGGWDHYECPACGASVCSFCDCPECGWYDGDAWEEAIRETARERADIYTGSLEVGEGCYT